MTLVLSVLGQDTIWMVTDRRLSRRGKPVTDSAVKVANLETTDGKALLGYAGLGATRSGTQPSTWMNSVLRARGGLTLEQALGTLSDAAKRELPKYLTGLPGGAHNIIIPAFVKGDRPRHYSIDNLVNSKTGEHRYRYTRHVISEDDLRSPPIFLGGTGGYLLSTKDRRWGRELLGLVKKYELGKIPERVVADRLAFINYNTHLELTDGTVGPRCVVIWRRRHHPRRPGPGGASHFYSGTDRERADAPIPTIANGMDVVAITDILMGQFAGLNFDELKSLQLDEAEIERRLKQLPSAPDEKLR